MLSSLEKPLNRPAFASQSDKIDARIRMSRSDKAQLSFIVRPFEPKPRDGERIVDIFKVDLQAAFCFAWKVF